MKAKILNYIKLGDERLPTYVSKKIRSYYVISAVAFLFGIVLSVIMKRLEPLGLVSAVAIICFLYGYAQHLSLSKNGCDIMDVTCIDVDYGKIPGVAQIHKHNKTPKRFLVVDNYEIVYALPYQTLATRLFNGAKARVYIEKSSHYYEGRDGATVISGLIGYELTGATSYTEENDG